MSSVSECYQSLTAHQHQNGHTVPKQVITIATSIQVNYVNRAHEIETCKAVISVNLLLGFLSNQSKLSN